MTLGDFGVFALLVASLGAAWVGLFAAAPAAARARFTWKVSSLHDRIEDAAIDGVVPLDDPCVRDFLARTELFMDEARHFTLGAAFCAHLATEELGVRFTLPEPSQFALSPEGRKLINAAERELEAVTRRYFFTGSLTGWIALGLRSLRRSVRSVQNHWGKPPTMHQLIDDYAYASALSKVSSDSKVAALH